MSVLLFCGQTYYPAGGWDDLRGEFASVHDAMVAFEAEPEDWAQVVKDGTPVAVFEDDEWVGICLCGHSSWEHGDWENNTECRHDGCGCRAWDEQPIPGVELTEHPFRSHSFSLWWTGEIMSDTETTLRRARVRHTPALPPRFYRVDEESDETRAVEVSGPWAFELDYTMGVTFTVFGTDLDAVDQEYARLKTALTADPVAAVVAVWAPRNNLVTVLSWRQNEGIRAAFESADR